MFKMLSDSIVIARIFLVDVRKGFLLYATLVFLFPLGLMMIANLISPMGDLESRIQLISGSTVASFAMVSVNALGQGMMVDKYTNRLKLLMFSAVNPLSYVLGFLISNALVCFIGAFGTLILGHVVWGVYVPLSLQLVIILILGWLSISGIGMIIGNYARNIREGILLSNVLSFVFVLLPPVYYSASNLPHPLQQFSYAIPTAMASQSIKSILMDASANLTINVIMLLVMVIAIFLLTAIKISWREK